MPLLPVVLGKRPARHGHGGIHGDVALLALPLFATPITRALL